MQLSRYIWTFIFEPAVPLNATAPLLFKQAEQLHCCDLNIKWNALQIIDDPFNHVWNVICLFSKFSPTSSSDSLWKLPGQRQTREIMRHHCTAKCICIITRIKICVWWYIIRQINYCYSRVSDKWVHLSLPSSFFCCCSFDLHILCIFLLFKAGP